MSVNNQQLFSYTYLERLLDDASFDDAALALARQIVEWAQFWDMSSDPGALHTAVLPTLDTLGFAYQIDSSDGHTYTLYADQSYTSLLGTLYVAPLGADLDETHQGQHWMFLAVKTARLHDKRWALLTNAIHWRLLDTKHVTPYEVYLELDLSGMREGTPFMPKLSRAIWAFLRRDAWLHNGDGESGLDFAETASMQAAARAEQHLNDHLESVLGGLCRGFIDGDGRQTYTEADRRAIFESATIAIYRMLFALYAESRALLPTDHPGYTEYSMRTLVDRAIALQQGLTNCNGTSIWDGLKQLWGWIDHGNPQIGINPYNGGLFSNAQDDEFGHDLSILRTQPISDAYLSRALVDLATIPEGNTRQLIDYRDLAVRHLGTLYEGILEHKLFIAEESMLARNTDKGVCYLRATGETQKKTDLLLDVGEVYFAQAPDERKATGSYYTPEYIVDYIVQNTVHIGLKERFAAFAPELNRYAPEEKDARLVVFIENQVLTYRVCDPAMGSGHFLVNAALTITSFIVETLNEYGSGNEVLNCDPALWRRRVVGSCLYGVDINPLAVELAKLSLWLTTVERARPLSFLDHHLRCGNSLVGVHLEDLPVTGLTSSIGKWPQGKASPESQFSFFDIPGVREGINRASRGELALEAAPEETPDDVHAKAKRYDAMHRELRRRYGLIADLSVARTLGLVLDDDTFRGLVRGYLDGDHGYVPQFARETVERTGVIARQYRFFHWQLEFPQVFYTSTNSLTGATRGFQAVIGNPPYVRQETLGNIKTLFEEQYEVYSGSADLYAYFIERGIGLLDPSGHFGYIVSNKWLRARYGEPLRRWLKQKRIVQLVDFGSLPVFNKVSAYPCILRVDGGPSQEGFEVATIDTLSLQDLPTKVRSLGFWVDQVSLKDGGWALVDRSTRNLLEKLRCIGIPLEQYVQGKIYRGIITGLNEAFVINKTTYQRLNDEDPRNSEILKPFLTGRSIKRYRTPRADSHLIFFPKGWTKKHTTDSPLASDYLKETYPSIAAHLAPFEQRAKRRFDKGDYWWEMRACDYYDEFERPKIVYPEIVSRGQITLDTSGFYGEATTFTIGSGSKYLLGVLNSKLTDYIVAATSAQLRGDYSRWKRIYVESLPIWLSDRSDPISLERECQIKVLADHILGLYEALDVKNGDEQALLDQIKDTDMEIDALVYQLYDLTENETAIVERRA
ncbi:MAG: Eco57I restriction-modification methylase domain-containing protein [Anaerolineae bacterium]